MSKKNIVFISSLISFLIVLFIYQLWFVKHSDYTTINVTPEDIAYLNKKFEKRNKHPKRYDKPKEAMLFYIKQRAPLGETTIPLERYAVAQQQMQQMPRMNSSQAQILPSFQARAPIANGSATQNFSGWESLGPGNVGGRTQTLAINPNNPNIMYTAGVAGGVWKTINAGQNWKPLDDLMNNMAVTSIVLDPNNPNTLYTATGEGFLAGDSVRGDGIFKSTNAGTTWRQLGSTSNNQNFHYVNKLVVSSNDSNRLYAATRTGIWYSINGGNTWSQSYIFDRNKYKNGTRVDMIGCLDIVVRTDRNPDVLTASCGSLVQGGLIHSENNGESWELSQADGMGRSSLAIAPSNQNVVYAMVSDARPSVNKSSLYGVYRSDDGGQSWHGTVDFSKKLNSLLLSYPHFAHASLCSNGQLEDSLSGQGWFANVIAVDPMNENIVWAGGIDLFRSDDGGENWGLASTWWKKGYYGYAHADQHGIYFHPDYNGTSNKTMFVSNDGGLTRTNNARANTSIDPCKMQGNEVAWTSLNNDYAVTQFFHGLAYPDGKKYFGGTQDNGTIKGTDATGNIWNEITGGDGGYVAIDPNNPQILFAEYVNLSLTKSIDGGQNFDDAMNGITENSNNFLFITPYIMDPNNAQNLWIGGKTVWRTKDQANTWSQASTTDMLIGESGQGQASAWAVAKGDSNFVLVGTDDGTIYRTQSALNTDSTTTWSSNRPAIGVVSSLAFDPNDKNIIYVTYSTFGIRHIFKSTNGGTTWQALPSMGESNDIPDIPVHVLVVDPDNSNRLFAGTDLGIFVSLDGGTTWAVENTGFTNTVVEHLQINKIGAVSSLFAFTHGRGAWRTVLKSLGSTPPSNNKKSIFDGAGSLINSSQNCWGCDKDEARMHPHSSAGSTVVFQWLHDNNNCQYVDVKSNKPVEVTVRQKGWDDTETKQAFKTTLSTSFISINPGAVWNTLSITSQSPINEEISIQAFCRKSSSATFISGNKIPLSNDLLEIADNFFWAGSGSIISQASRGGFGVNKDYAIVLPNKKSLTSFQWYASESCNSLKFSDIDDEARTVDLSYKTWDSRSFSTGCSVLPCIFQNFAKAYYVISIKSNANEISKGIKAECQ